MTTMPSRARASTRSRTRRLARPVSLSWFDSSSRRSVWRRRSIAWRASSTSLGRTRSSSMRAGLRGSTTASSGGPSPSERSIGNASSSASAAGTTVAPSLCAVSCSRSAAALADRMRRSARRAPATMSDAMDGSTPAEGGPPG